ncbi:MAG: glucokinase [Chloroflexota bacterium]
MEKTLLLAGDIGGTKTVLALFEESGAGLPIKPIVEKTYPSSQFSALEQIIEDFMQGFDVDITAASFGVAGPVVNGRSQITNLPWIIDVQNLKQQLGIETVTLLNDLESIANGVPYLQPDDVVNLKEGQKAENGAIGIVAPGTGLGEAFLVWTGTRYESYPSEGGHASFGPVSSLQVDLLNFLATKYNHVSYERVCSGSGLPNLYQFFKETNRFEEPAWLAKELESTPDKTPIIVQHAVQKSANICIATLNLFFEILAGEASNMALKLLATGGIYLGGGIPPRLIPQLQASNFTDIFQSKGRFTNLLEQVPVYIICNPKIALYGAAYQGLNVAKMSGS